MRGGLFCFHFDLIFFFFWGNNYKVRWQYNIVLSELLKISL